MISYIACFPLSSLIYAMYLVYMNCIMKTINHYHYHYNYFAHSKMIGTVAQ